MNGKVKFSIMFLVCALVFYYVVFVHVLKNKAGLAIFACVTFVFALLILFSLYRNRRYQDLIKSGEEGAGIVVGYSKARYWHWPRRHMSSEFALVQYATKDGKLIKSKIHPLSELATRPKIGDDVIVKYNPEN